MPAEENAALKGTWPPTPEDLRRLYVDEKLSAAKIAKIYDHNTGNLASAAELIRHYLKKYGIKRRNRIEELRKETEVVVTAWKARHPKMESGETAHASGERELEEADEPFRLTPEEGAVIELLRVENLSIRHLDAETKERVREVVNGLHWMRGLSLNDIADLIGNKTSGYSSWLFERLELNAKPFEESRIEGIHKHVRIYERKPFDGTDEDKAYLLGVARGDLHIATPWNGVISASTSTTRPAMVQLFRSLFSRYGHVYLLPRYKYDTETYEWNVQVILDDSFGFLLLPDQQVWEWVSQRESTLLSYLAGIWDAEGSVEIRENRKVVSIRLPMYNTNLGLVEFVVKSLRALGYTPWGPYLAKRKGETSTKWGIPLRKDYWKAEVLDLDESQGLLKKLPLRHNEKVDLKTLALELKRGDRWDWVKQSVEMIKYWFKIGRNKFVAAARLELEVRRRRRLLKREGFGQAQVPLPGHESPPVACVLLRDAWKTSGRKQYNEIVEAADSGSLAIHYSVRCLQRKPCVIICWDCDAQNIVPILVHESIHHAVLWMNRKDRTDEDRLDDLAYVFETKGIRMEELPLTVE